MFFVNCIYRNAGETANFSEGSILIAEDGSYTFTPRLNYTGLVSDITYVLSDVVFTSSTNLLLTVEYVDNLLNITNIDRCNQGFNDNIK